MAKNIVILSDGTGQAGGINFDEARTNVYKIVQGVSCGCACRKSNSHIQMMKSAKKWRRQNATNGMYCSRRRRVLVD